MMFTGSLSLYAIYRVECESFVALVVGPMLTLTAVGMETVADVQMDKFASANKASDAVMSAGLWNWCRHPNYFGEFGFWFDAHTN